MPLLLQFVVENHRSFRDQTVLNLVVPPELGDVPGTVEVPGIGRVQRVVALYGANASGKSALVEAFYLACDLATEGVAPKRPIPVRPFKLEPDQRKRPTRFELDVLVGGVHYAYGLAVDARRVLEEWLYVVEESTEHLVFERSWRDEPTPEVRYGTGLGRRTARTDFYRVLAEGTRHEQPLLAEFAARNAYEFEPLGEFLHTASLPLTPYFGFDVDEESDAALRKMLAGWPELRDWMGHFLAEAGTGVTRIGLRTTSSTLQEAIDRRRNLSLDDLVEYLDDDDTIDIYFEVPGAGGRLVQLEMDEVSDGTRRLVELGLCWFPEIVESDQLHVIDELDRSMHTVLTQRLVRLAVSAPPTSRHQFVFTTHDTNLLDANLLNRDAVRFVEKDAEGVSHLSSLAEFKAEQLDALEGAWERGYLQGRFGAIPFIGDPVRLGWVAAEGS